MLDLPHENPDLVIRIPLPNVDISEHDLSKTKSEFRSCGVIASLRTEETYPCSLSWAEIAILSGAGFLANAALNHYAEKLFDALDRSLKKKFDVINLSLSRGRKTISRDIPRTNRAEAIGIIDKALEELGADDDDTIKPQ